MTKKLSKNIFFCLALIVGTIVLWVSFESSSLRPVADDYCHGSTSAEFGLFGGITHWWNTWSGFLSVTFISSILVGMPLALLPFNIASAICFAAAAFGMGAVVICILRAISSPLKLSWIWLLILAFSWWAFLWASPALGIHDQYLLSFANGLTFWQTINAQYVVTLQVLIIALAFSWPFLREKQSFISFLAPLAIGLYVGAAGTGLTVVCFVIASGFAVWAFLKRKTSDVERSFWLILCVSVLVSAIFCHFFSPGNITRAKAINPNYLITFERLLFLIKVTTLEGVWAWLRGYFNLGGVVSFSLASGFSYFVSKSSKQEHVKSTLYVAIAFSIFALAHSLVTRLSEEFSYVAYWHYASPMVCIFLSLTFFGIWAGSKMKGGDHPVAKRCMATLFLLALSIGVRANIVMVENIESRKVEWSSGPSATVGTSDINDPSGWQMACWQKLNSLRSNSIRRSPEISN